jgi:hypothetical protein
MSKRQFQPNGIGIGRAYCQLTTFFSLIHAHHCGEREICKTLASRLIHARIAAVLKVTI